MMVSYVNPNSRKGFLNSFADYIVEKLDASSQIKVTDTNNFVLVNGVTNSKTILNLTEIKNSFIEKNKDFNELFGPRNFNLVDTITYNKAPVVFCTFNYVYYNSKRPIYHPEVINFLESSYLKDDPYSKVIYNNRLIFEINFESHWMNEHFKEYETTLISSEFPHGYKNLYRNIMYYGEYITNHLFNYIHTDEICLKINMCEQDNINVQVECESIYSKDKIESLIMDVFDFNLKKFEVEYLSKYDFKLDSTIPLGEKPWLVKDKIKDILIL